MGHEHESFHPLGTVVVGHEHASFHPLGTVAVDHEHASFHPLGTVAFTLKPVSLLLKNDLMQMYLETEKDISLSGPLLKSHKMSQIVSSMLPNMPCWLECYYFLSQPVTGNRKEMDVTSSA